MAAVSGSLKKLLDKSLKSSEIPCGLKWSHGGTVILECAVSNGVFEAKENKFSDNMIFGAKQQQKQAREKRIYLAEALVLLERFCDGNAMVSGITMV
jgi:hypothetical protein